tara:strand:- start:250 stop:432 length:183 start_codon:yes stop_codon:yes gene_type:complete
METPKTKICPKCKGNGYLKVLIEEGREEIVTQCSLCESEGEVSETDNHLFITADGLHKLQ